jgi:5-methylthioadenosine/S-adenosylhomocysteine deaminase
VGGTIAIRHGRILLPDGSLALADLLIEDGTITTVGGSLAGWSGAELNAQGMVVAPGLINSHMHSGENFNPGLYENLPLDVWFVRSHQVTRTAPPSREAIYVRTMLGAALMLQSGTTSTVDFLYEAPEITLETLEPVVQAYRDAGLRATILLGVADLPFAESLPLGDAGGAAAHEAPVPGCEQIMALAEAAVDRFHDPNGMIRIGLGPSAPQRCSRRLLLATLQLARERGLVWQTHVLETKTQAATCRDWHGATFVEELDREGVLGPGTTLVHTVWLTDRDIELMSASGTAAVHCLMSNLRLGDGVARLPAMRRAGVRVALGTDGRGCDETLDMLELTRMTAFTHKARGGDYQDWPSAFDALAMATTEASAVTGHGTRLGRLEPGARGDLILLRSESLAFAPVNDPVRQLVFGAQSRDVDTVIVDGQVVVSDGRPTKVNTNWLTTRVAELAPEMVTSSEDTDADQLEASVREMYLGIEGRQIDVDAYLRP